MMTSRSLLLTAALFFAVVSVPLAAHDISGVYTGTYTFQYDQLVSGPCHPVSMEGTISFDLQQSGTEVDGFVTMTEFVISIFDQGGSCSPQVQTMYLPLEGFVDGDYVQLKLPDDDEDPDSEVYFQFYGDVVGDSYDGSIDWFVEDSNEHVDIGGGLFHTGSGASAITEIVNFDASPSRVLPGEKARLMWATGNAASVSISPSVGPVGPRGSVEVSPMQTTTYTLTATGSEATDTAQVTIVVPSDPLVTVTSLPEPLVQGSSAGGDTTTYTLTNQGGDSTQITLSRLGDFFTQSPESFTLQPGQSQTVTITSLVVAQDAYRGASVPSGAGVPSGLQIPVTLLAWPSPTGPTSAKAELSRVDVSAPEGESPQGTARFVNDGEAQIAAVVTSNVPWIVPPDDVFVIDPGHTADIPFSIDRSRRPPGNDIGSVAGTLALTFRQGSAGKGGIETRDGAATTTSLVTIVDTSRPTVQQGVIPPLGLGEVALFVPGVGHVQGSVGLFLSDVSISNLTGSSEVNNLSLYYTALGQASTLTTSIGAVAPGQPVALADIVQDVFQQDGQVGSLQIRGSVDSISVNANILNVSNPLGTFGTTIPTLRSDRSAAEGQSLYLTGLRKSATSHTNLYIQETRGAAVTVAVQYLGASGSVLGTTTLNAAPFQLVRVLDSLAPAPDGTVSAILTAGPGSAGAFSAYATPVDRASGDTWAVVDWNSQLGYTGGERLVVPVAGSLEGNNQTYFRTDVDMMSRGTGPAQGTLRYHPRGSSSVVERAISLQPNETRTFDDIVTNFLEVAPGTVGFLEYIPQSGNVTMTSRTFTTVAGGVATFGSGTPTIAAVDALKLGDTRRIGGIDDASSQSISQKVPATFRTNFGLLETSGQSVIVRATLHYSYATGATAAVRGRVTKDYPLGANGFLLINGIGQDILGPERNTRFGNLSNLQVEFSVIEGSGETMLFVSSVDNGTGDSILRTE